MNLKLMFQWFLNLNWLLNLKKGFLFTSLYTLKNKSSSKEQKTFPDGTLKAVRKQILEDKKE